MTELDSHGPASERPPRVSFQGVSKQFFGVTVLNDVAFDVATGIVVGLVGENGAGKSTLMNLLGGVLEPSAGTMTLNGELFAPTAPMDADQAGVVFVHQELNLFPNLSIADNLFLTDYPPAAVPLLIGRRAARKRAQELLNRIGLDRDPNTTVDLLSAGERQQVEIAKALQGDPQVVIFDEPTTSLTARETSRLFDLIRELAAQGTSVFYVSHILQDIQQICDEIVILRDGDLIDTGPAADFPVGRMISQMVGRNLDQLYPEKIATRTDDQVLAVEGLTEPGIIRDVDLRVHRGEVVGLFGLMGAGRSETARIIYGLDRHRSGTIALSGRHHSRIRPRSAIREGLAFVTEDRRHEGLLMDSSVTDNIALTTLERNTSVLGWIKQSSASRKAVEVAQSLGLKSANPRRQAVRALSGGNQQKAVIAKWLLTKPDVLILDEPTRGIDVGAKHEVYRVIDELAASGAGVLLISSELAELTGTCDSILVMRQGEIVATFDRPEFEEESMLAAAFGQHRDAKVDGQDEGRPS